MCEEGEEGERVQRGMAERGVEKGKRIHGIIVQSYFIFS